jgi:hypothetical protein
MKGSRRTVPARLPGGECPRDQGHSMIERIVALKKSDNVVPAKAGTTA